MTDKSEHLAVKCDHVDLPLQFLVLNENTAQVYAAVVARMNTPAYVHTVAAQT